MKLRLETEAKLYHLTTMQFIVPLLLAVVFGVASYLFSVTKSNNALAANSEPLNDPSLENIFQRMANALGVQYLRLNIYKIDAVNGLAAANSQIYITQGFIKKYAGGEVTATELASVVAHELGHVALGHTRRRLIDFSGQNAMKTALSITLNRFIPFIGPWIANLAVTIVAARMSRKDEFEADAYATALMIKAGLGVRSQKDLLSKLDKITGVGGGTPAWFLSHPKTKDRLRAIEQNELKWTGELS